MKIETMLGAVVLWCQRRPASAITAGVLVALIGLVWTVKTGELLPFVD